MKNILTLTLITIFSLVSTGFAAQTTEPTKVTVFENGNPFHTRIPSIVKLANGNLMAFCDDRKNNDADIGTDVSHDIVARISTDNGKTWGDIQYILTGDSKASDYTFSYGDAATVVDRETGEILLMCTAGKQGMKYPPTTPHVLFAKANGSVDGQNWTHSDVSDHIYSLRTDITQGFITSGHICQSSRIKVGSHYRIYAAVATFAIGSYVIYSDDFGETWQCLGGSSANPGMNGSTMNSSESKLEELPDGNVLMSCRGMGTQTGRYYNLFTYTDQKTAEGKWGELVHYDFGDGQSKSDGEVLLIPAKDANGNNVDVLLQTADIKGRNGIKIFYKALKDNEDYDTPPDFLSWTSCSFQLSSTTSAYSTMTLDQNNNIAFLYEENSNIGYDIVFQSMSLSYITDGKYTFDSDRGDAIDYLAKPLFSANEGEYPNEISVEITCATNGATIYYTTDGSEPTTASNKYTGVLSISKTTTLKAIAVKGELQSEVATATYKMIVAKPTMSPEPNTFYEPQSVTITYATNGATIYYTTDGSEPTTASNKYTGAISISETTTLKAIAVKGELQSEVATATYTIIEKTEEILENVLPEDGGVYTIYAYPGTTSYRYYVYNDNGTLSMRNVSSPIDANATTSYLWVCSKASDGTYYFSSLDGQGYFGRDASDMNDAAYAIDFNNVMKVSFQKDAVSSGSYTGAAMKGYALKFLRHNSSAYGYVSVNGSSFDRMSITHNDYNGWTTDFVFNKVPYVKGGTGCGTLGDAMHHGFSVKFARNDDGAATAGEDYDCYATLNLPFTVSLPDGVTAYKIKSLSKKVNTAVDIEEYSEAEIPRETPVLLRTSGAKGDGMETKTINFKPTTAKEDTGGTGLAGTLGRQVFDNYNESTGDSDGTIYYLLGKKDGHVAFYYLAANKSGEMAIANNKAYYKYTVGSSAKPAMLTLSFGGAATGITDIGSCHDGDDGLWFDLMGRRVTQPAHGIFIRNGKKVVLP